METEAIKDKRKKEIDSKNQSMNMVRRPTFMSKHEGQATYNIHPRFSLLYTYETLSRDMKRELMI